MNDFDRANADYEAWLRSQCDVVEDDLRYKHQRMRRNPFTFLRATCFRWSATIETICPDLAAAPLVLGIGDAHVENFGTWRDGDGRMVWGVNDFDDVDIMPYPFDLVRLAASARLAPDLPLDGNAAALAILAGYRKGLEQPRATLVHEHTIWMRARVEPSDEACIAFWKEIEACPPAAPPADVEAALRQSLPEGAVLRGFVRRPRKGGGGLGRPRFVAIADWHGGLALREAKAWVPSAWAFAHAMAGEPTHYAKAAHGAYRSPDPALGLEGRYIIRRIAPDSRKVELGDDAGAKLGARLLGAMGFDLAAIHAGAGTPAAAIAADLSSRPADWLHQAAKRMAAAVTADFEALGKL